MEASLYINTLVGEGSLGDIVGITVSPVRGALDCAPGLIFVMLFNAPVILVASALVLESRGGSIPAESQLGDKLGSSIHIHGWPSTVEMFSLLSRVYVLLLSR